MMGKWWYQTLHWRYKYLQQGA